LPWCCNAVGLHTLASWKSEINGTVLAGVMSTRALSQCWFRHLFLCLFVSAQLSSCSFLFHVPWCVSMLVYHLFCAQRANNACAGRHVGPSIASSVCPESRSTEFEFCTYVVPHFTYTTFGFLQLVTTGVGVAMSYGLGVRVRFLAGTRYFSLLSVQTRSGAHLASYPMGTRSSFSGGKATGT
jgi:hypothetical protein